MLDPETIRQFFHDIQKMSPDEILEAEKEFLDVAPVRFETLLVAMLENDAIHGAVKHDQVQDMSKPLTHYWINSSHNT